MLVAASPLSGKGVRGSSARAMHEDQYEYMCVPVTVSATCRSMLSVRLQRETRLPSRRSSPASSSAPGSWRRLKKVGGVVGVSEIESRPLNVWVDQFAEPRRSSRRVTIATRFSRKFRPSR